MAMDEYRPIGSVFLCGSYHYSMLYRIRTYIPAGCGSWLVVYADQVADGANFVSWSGECLLSWGVGFIRIDYRSQGEFGIAFSAV